MKKMLFLIMFITLLSGCMGDDDIRDYKTHFFIHFGAESGQLGRIDPASFKQPVMDRMLFSTEMCFNHDAISILDSHNNRVMQLDESGKILKEIPLPPQPEAAPPQEALQFISTDPDKNILLLSTTVSQGLAKATLWKSSDNAFINVHSLAVTNLSETYVSHTVLEAHRVQKIFSIDNNTTAIVWEKLRQVEPRYGNTVAAEYSINTSRVDIVDINRNTHFTVEFDARMFQGFEGNGEKFFRISDVIADRRRNILLVEALFSKAELESDYTRKLIRHDYVTGIQMPLHLPIDNWVALLGMSRANELFVLRNVLSRDNVTRAIIFAYEPEKKERRNFAIENDPALVEVGSLYFSQNGKVYSFMTDPKGISIISWD